VARVNEFNYLGYKLSFVGELDLPGKISKCSRTMGIINNILKPSVVQKHTRIRICKTLARPVLCYGSDACTIRKSDESIIAACEMMFHASSSWIYLMESEEELRGVKRT
jgi:hypothetical protein